MFNRMCRASLAQARISTAGLHSLPDYTVYRRGTKRASCRAGMWAALAAPVRQEHHVGLSRGLPWLPKPDTLTDSRVGPGREHG